MLIARIYLNLYRADARAIAHAIASDGQSYTDDMFGTAIEVGRRGVISQARAAALIPLLPYTGNLALLVVPRLSGLSFCLCSGGAALG